MTGKTDKVGSVANSSADTHGAAGANSSADAHGAAGSDAAVARAVADPVSRATSAAASARLSDKDYMRLAFDEARRAESLGEVPIGAVVVYEPIDPATRRPQAPPRVIARACNMRETTRDPAGHAEFLAMKEASRVLSAWRLTDCTVYVTLEPCIMCAGLMHQARISRCVYGAPDPKAGALGTLYSVNEDTRLNHVFEVRAGVLKDECSQIISTFFANKRKK